jgi:hypothetical protein
MDLGHRMKCLQRRFAVLRMTVVMFVGRALVVMLAFIAVAGCTAAAKTPSAPTAPLVDAGGSDRATADSAGGRDDRAPLDVVGVTGGDTAVSEDMSRPDVPSAADAAAADGSRADVPAGPGPNLTFNPFTDVYLFGNHDGGSQRSFDVTVDFPAMPLSYQNITLKIALRCPTAAPRSCDYVDQRGFVGVVRKSGGVETVHELQRFITPYGAPATFTADITSIRPLLAGPVVVRLWVDTWAHSGSNIGDGWRVDVTFDFVGGVPARVPISVVPLWGETIFDYGDPAKPQPYIPAQQVTIPTEARGVEIRSFITGHGQGNSENCGEFCQKTHTFTIGTRPFTRSIWRNDCQTTASRNQTSGAYVYPRAGWCPGATVLPWVQDVTAAAPAGQVAQVSYGIQAYTNTCQPSNCTLMSCAFYGTSFFNGSCVYDQQFHAVPYYVLSSLLVVYGN